MNYLVVKKVGSSPVIFSVQKSRKNAIKYIDSYNKKVALFTSSNIYKKYWENEDKLNSPGIQKTKHIMGKTPTIQLLEDLKEKYTSKYIRKAVNLHICLDIKKRPVELKGDPDEIIYPTVWPFEVKED